MGKFIPCQFSDQYFTKLGSNFQGDLPVQWFVNVWFSHVSWGATICQTPYLIYFIVSWGMEAQRGEDLVESHTATPRKILKDILLQLSLTFSLPCLFDQCSGQELEWLLITTMTICGMLTLEHAQFLTLMPCSQLPITCRINTKMLTVSYQTLTHFPSLPTLTAWNAPHPIAHCLW